MASNNAFIRVVKSLKANSKNGCSEYQIAKEQGIPRSPVQFHIKNLRDMNLITKVGKGKYRLTAEAFPSGNGSLVTIDTDKVVLIHLCEYTGECPCVGTITEDCRKYQELPIYIKDRIDPHHSD